MNTEREQEEYYEWQAYQRLCDVCHRDVGEQPACTKYDRQADGHCVCGHDEACHGTEGAAAGKEQA